MSVPFFDAKSWSTELDQSEAIFNFDRSLLLQLMFSLHQSQLYSLLHHLLTFQKFLKQMTTAMSVFTFPHGLGQQWRLLRREDGRVGRWLPTQYLQYFDIIRNIYMVFIPGLWHRTPKTVVKSGALMWKKWLLVFINTTPFNHTRDCVNEVILEST